MSDTLTQLQRHFGNNLDKEVLSAVLEMCNGSLQDAIKFLEIQNNDTKQVEAYEQHVKQSSNSNQQGGNLPLDYHRKPDNWMPIVASKQEKADPYLERALSLRKLFIEDSLLETHIKIQFDPIESPVYTAVLLILLHQGVELSHVTKARILVGLWARKQYALADYLLTKYDKLFGLIEVLRALKILDAPRKIKCIEKRIEKLKKCSTKQRVLNKIRGQINDIKHDMVPEHLQIKTSVSGSLAKKIRAWIQKIPREQLQFFALHLPREPWQELADIIHCSPSDFKLDYFLKHTFGDEAPKDSVVEACKNLNAANLLQVVNSYHVPYSYLRKKVPQMSLQVRLAIAQYEDISTILWWYEELSAGGSNQEIDQIIMNRLAQGEVPNFGYGKLMERLLLFKQLNTCFYSQLLPMAEEKLKNYRLPLEPVVVVAGDCSFSMDIAIKTSTIISSVVVALTNDAELKFFNVQSIDAPQLPKTAAQVLELSKNTKTNGLTAPACLLWDYYNNKRAIKLFIIVTDEIENEKSNNTFFAQLFYKYYTEVYAAKIMFISFVENPNTQTKGRMAIALEHMGIQPLVFTLDSVRPDLTKLDKIIGILSSETKFFGTQVEFLAKSVASKSIVAAIEDLPRLPQPESLPPRSEESLVVEKARAITPAEKESLVEPSAPIAQEEEKAKIQAAKVEEAKLVQQVKNQHIDENGTPLEFLCPITQEVMKEPVICADGFTYEKASLLQWFENHDTSPMTGVKLDVKIVFPNHQLRSRIKDFLGQ